MARKRYVLLEQDYDRIELVFLAFLAQEKAMMKALLAGLDLHTVTAQQVFAVKNVEDVTGPQRDLGKKGNFAKVYGESVATFARRNNLTMKESKNFHDKFDKAYPGIEPFFKSIDHKIVNGIPVRTIFDRRRLFYVTANKKKNSRQILQGRNYVIQSPASDNTLKHLIHLFSILDREMLHKVVIPINFVHDSIWFLIWEKYMMEMAEMIKYEMERTDIDPVLEELNPPLVVSGKWGYDLASMEKIVNAKKKKNRKRIQALNRVSQSLKAG